MFRIMRRAILYFCLLSADDTRDDIVAAARLFRAVVFTAIGVKMVLSDGSWGSSHVLGHHRDKLLLHFFLLVQVRR